MRTDFPAVAEITIDRKKIVKEIPPSGRVRFVDGEIGADECRRGRR